MRPDEIAWGSGEVVHWDLNFLEPQRPLADQAEGLKEDLAQIKYPNDVLLDIGWYPEFSEAGEFVTRVIHQFNWDAPLFVGAENTFAAFLSVVHKAIAVAQGCGRINSLR